MLKFNKEFNFVQNIDSKGEVLAEAQFKVLNKEEFNDYIDTLILKEVKDIRTFDCVDMCMTDEDILIEFSDNFEELFILKEKLAKEDTIIYIDTIVNTGVKKGAAKDIIDYFKVNYKKIFVYPLSDVIFYWENCGFVPMYRDDYFFFGLNF